MTAPARPSPFTHLKRAFGWNLGRVTLATSEQSALESAGVTNPVVQRYAAWRRSLLLVALIPAICATGVIVMDNLEDGAWDGLLAPGLLLQVGFLAAAGVLTFGCLRGVAGWKRPQAAARTLTVGWACAVLVPVLWFLLPDHLLFEAEAQARAEKALNGSARFDDLLEVLLNIVRYGGMALMLLPGLMSVIPGAVNGCLRVKSLLPAAQLPGWLLVCGAPLFLLIWIALLALGNVALQSSLIVLGVCLWAGAPIWYALQGRVFVQSQLGPEDRARISRVKRVVGILALAGIATTIVGVLSTKVAGLSLLGFDEEGALSVRLAEWLDDGAVFDLEHVEEELQSATSFAYALDLSFAQLLLDALAKLLVSTAVFAHLAMRATVSAWGNDRALRVREEAAAFDADASAMGSALTGSKS